MVPNLFIAHATNMSEDESIPKRLQELWQLDEQWFLVDFHQTVKKERQTVWHDKHIKKSFSVEDRVLLYDSKYLKHPGKLQMHWHGLFYVAKVRNSGTVKLAQLDGILLPSWVNSARLKPYFGS